LIPNKNRFAFKESSPKKTRPRKSSRIFYWCLKVATFLFGHCRISCLFPSESNDWKGCSSEIDPSINIVSIEEKTSRCCIRWDATDLCSKLLGLFDPRQIFQRKDGLCIVGVLARYVPLEWGDA
jgi:hypothetical protein